jgi:fatty acid desaturase
MGLIEVDRIEEPRAEDDVRRSLERLPRPVAALAEPIWGTRLHAAPPVRRTAIGRLLSAAGMLAAGVALSVAGLQRPPMSLPLLLPGLLLATGGARYLQIVIHHHAVHQRLVRGAAMNRLLGQAISAVLLTQDYDGFYVDHIKKHHPNGKLARRGDPDLETLIALGIVPGVQREELWRRFVKTLISPRYHLLFLRERLAANFVRSTGPRRLAAAMIWSTAVLALVLFPAAIAPFLIAYLLPITIGYHMSALMQFTSEHVWLTPCRAVDDARSRARRATRGRFCGDRLPPPDLHAATAAIAWGKWWLRLLTVHAAARIAVLHGDLPHHDLHHIRPTDLDWPNSDAERLSMRTHEELGEVWGLWNALDQVFETLSALDPMEPATATADGYNAAAFASM